MTVAETVQDEFRINFFGGYLAAMQDAMTLDGVDVIGYQAWSFLDNFEWCAC